MNDRSRSDLKKMMELAETIKGNVCTHLEYLEAEKLGMEAGATIEKQRREISRLTAAVGAAENAKEKLRISYFKNNERRRMVTAYNQMHDEKEALKRTIESLHGDIATMKAEQKNLRAKCAMLAMEAGQRAEIDG
jgi:hypothetical protein